jgi:hypothetical protein
MSVEGLGVRGSWYSQKFKMIAVNLVVLMFSILSISGNDNNGRQWRPVSDKDRGIEFQWYQPARNSCVVQIRDLHFKRQTQVTLMIRYLPHRAAKNDIATKTAPVDMKASGSSEEHISSCEEVLTVALAGSVRRE